MDNIEQEYINDFEKYLTTDEDTTEPQEEIVAKKGLRGNITYDEIRSVDQALLYLVVDKSSSMYHNGLEKGIVDGLNEVKKVVNGVKESKYIQTAMTFFGSTLDMRPFKYGECIDTSYEATESQSRMYDAIVESCSNMISQYDNLISECKIRGVMLILTDGHEVASEYNLDDAKNALKELMKREIVCLITTFDGIGSLKLCNDLGIETVPIKDNHQLRILMKLVSQHVMV